MTKHETIYVYAEHCTLAGHHVRMSDVQANHVSYASDDWIAVEATEDEAHWWEGHSRFGRRVATTIRDHIAATA